MHLHDKAAFYSHSFLTRYSVMLRIAFPATCGAKC